MTIVRNIARNRSLLLLAYPSLLVAAAVLLTLFRVSGTSVGMYVTGGVYSPPALPDPSLLAGTPRFSRWDEWHVDTPYIVSQSKLGYPRFTPSAVGGQDLSVILDIPNRHWSTFFKPYNWPFFALHVERAFVMRWWLVALLLLIPSYALFVVMTGRIVLACAFSASLFVSPFFHWWYSPGSVAVVGLAMAALASLIGANRRVGIVRWLLLVVSAYSLIAFALLIYPPFQIPTAMVIGLIGVGWLLGEVARAANGRERLRPVVATAIVGVIAATVLVAYYIDVSPTITAITSTVYPGQRRISGGGAQLSQLFGAPFDFWLATTNDQRVNQPDSSSFLLTGIFVIPQVVLLARYRASGHITWFVWPAAAALILLLAWALLPFPTAVGKLALLDRVPPKRVILGVGIASFLVTFLALAAGRTSTPGSRWVEWVVNVSAVLGAGAVAAVGGAALDRQAPSLNLSISAIAVGSFAFAFVVALVLTRRLLASGLALVLIGALLSSPVNPIYRGLGPLVSSPLLYAVELGAPASTSTSGGAVLSYLGPPADGLIVSSGRPVLNATNLYPVVGAWRALDPNGVYTQVWDRYALAVFVYSSNSPAKVSLLGVDAVQVAVNPCDAGLNDLHVTTVISPRPLNDPCLTELGRTPFIGDAVAYTYRRR